MSSGPPRYQGRLVLRSLIFLFGIFLITFGVAISVRAGLGTTPISTPPYVVGLTGWMSFGVATMVINTAFTLVQIPMLGRRFGLIHILQIPVGLVFGALIDVSMWLTRWLQPESYLWQWVAVLAGCLVVALGVVLQFTPRLLLTPGDGLIAALAHRTGVLVGNMKVMFDVSNVIVGALMSLLWLGGVEGIREGTLVAMILVGLIVGRVLPRMDRGFSRFMGQPID